MALNVKKGDNVLVIAGKDKGKTGRVIKTLKKDNKVVVEGINVIKKHVKPNRMNEVGSIVEVEAPIHVSNVKVIEEDKKANEDYVIFDEYPFFFNAMGLINGDRNTLVLVNKKTLEITDLIPSTVDVESYDVDGDDSIPPIEEL